MRRTLAAVGLAAALAISGAGAAASDEVPPASDGLATCDYQWTWKADVCAFPWSTSIAQQNAQMDTEPVRHYIVRRHDNLWRISVRMCGNGHKWKQIRKANHIRGTLIRTGQLLTIPCKHP